MLATDSLKQQSNIVQAKQNMGRQFQPTGLQSITPAQRAMVFSSLHLTLLEIIEIFPDSLFTFFLVAVQGTFCAYCSYCVGQHSLGKLYFLCASLVSALTLYFLHQLPVHNSAQYCYSGRLCNFPGLLHAPPHTISHQVLPILQPKYFLFNLTQYKFVLLLVGRLEVQNQSVGRRILPLKILGKKSFLTSSHFW